MGSKILYNYILKCDKANFGKSGDYVLATKINDLPHNDALYIVRNHYGSMLLLNGNHLTPFGKNKKNNSPI